MARSAAATIEQFEVGDLVTVIPTYYSSSLRGQVGVVMCNDNPDHAGRTGNDVVYTVDWDNAPNHLVIRGDIVLHTKKKDVVSMKQEYDEKYPWLKGLFEEMYGENADIVEDGRKMAIIIKYDEFTIINSRKNKHVIRDLYVKLSISSAGLSPSLQGYRQTRTIKEWESAYRHSHLPGGVDNRFNTFCLGHGTPIVDALLAAKLEPSEDTFFQLCCVIDNYVKWESLEGGPHFRMGDIRNRSGNNQVNISSSDINSTLSAINASSIVIPLKYDERAYIPKVTLDRTNKDFIKLLNESATKHIKRHKVTHAELTEAPQSSNLEAILKQFESEKPHFTFRGQPVKRGIYGASVTTDVNMDEYYEAIHPTLEQYVVEKIEEKLRQFVNNGEVK